MYEAGVGGLPELMTRVNRLDERLISNSSRVERGIAALALATLCSGVLATDYQHDEGNILDTLRVSSCSGECFAAGEPKPIVLAKPTDIPQGLATPNAQKRTAQLMHAQPKTVPRLSEKPAIPELSPRHLSYENFKYHAPQYFAHLPSLSELAQRFPATVSTHSAERQLAYINQLAQTANVTPADYEQFEINQQYRSVFKGVGSYENYIKPKFFIIHWTAQYYDDPAHLAHSMGLNRIDYYIDRSSTTYQLFENDHHQPGHALSMNKMSQGVEIEAKGTLDYTPAQLESAILLAVNFCRRNGLAVDQTTILGHYAADLIFANPYYSPKTGKFTYPRIHKFDPPQELMQVIVAKAQALDVALGPRR